MLRGFYQYFALHHCERKLSSRSRYEEILRQWKACPATPWSTTPAELGAVRQRLVV